MGASIEFRVHNVLRNTFVQTYRFHRQKEILQIRVAAVPIRLILSYCLSAESKSALFFDVSLTVHLSITLANDQIDAQIFNSFITILYMYMFRAISCSSSRC